MFYVSMAAVMLAAMLPTAAAAPVLQPGQAAMPNALTQPDRCRSIPQQVAGDDRRLPGTRLDQQPAGRLLHAVDRQVAGCREVTFVGEGRR